MTMNRRSFLHRAVQSSLGAGVAATVHSKLLAQSGDDRRRHGTIEDSGPMTVLGEDARRDVGEVVGAVPGVGADHDDRVGREPLGHRRRRLGDDLDVHPQRCLAEGGAQAGRTETEPIAHAEAAAAVRKPSSSI